MGIWRQWGWTFRAETSGELEDASQGGLGPHQGGPPWFWRNPLVCPQPEKEPALGHLPHREPWCLSSLHLASVSSLAGSIAASTEWKKLWDLLCADRGVEKNKHCEFDVNHHIYTLLKFPLMLKVNQNIKINVYVTPRQYASKYFWNICLVKS